MRCSAQASRPARPGKLRAVVLAVNVPGLAPYAVYAPEFKCEVDLLEPLWMPLSALVGADDPGDVEILRDEVPSYEAQLADRIAGSQATPASARVPGG